ncbi:MAG: hypothetical protein M1830_008512 [Pleopsidium flavum]|nr:MAG: hypothetical protein M1830_008512 [Pleopsidium flavum]
MVIAPNDRVSSVILSLSPYAVKIAPSPAKPRDELVSVRNFFDGDRADSREHPLSIVAHPKTKISRGRRKTQGSSIRPSTSLVEKARTRKGYRRITRDSETPDPFRQDSETRSNWRRQSQQDTKHSEAEGWRYFPRLGRIVESQEYKRRVYKSTTSVGGKWSGTNKMAFADQARISGSSAKRSSNFKSPTSPSVISILSGVTNVSGGSSGSNSTVTQESISRPKSQSSKRSSVARADMKRRGTRKAASAHSPQPTTIDERPDVFAFMENGSTSTVDMQTSSASAIGDVTEKKLTQILSDTTSEDQLEDHDDHSDSFHSDSGVSVREGSPERLFNSEANQSDRDGRSFAKNKAQSRGVFEPLPAKPRQDADLAYPPSTGGVRRWSSTSDSGIGSSVDEYCGYDQPNASPEAYYARAPPSAALHVDAPSVPYALPDMRVPAYVPIRPHVPHTDKPKETFAGYERLASKLSSIPDGTDTLTPIYRKFETLNNRILLYLQDEISEIEENLRSLDEADAQAYAALSSNAGVGRPVQASRRREGRMPSEIHFRRLDLLGRAFVKVGQYNQALSSYSALIKGLHSAKGADVEAYRAWIDEHSTIVESETRFLNHEADLLALTSPSPNGSAWRGPSSPARHSGTAAAHMAIVVSAVAVLIPLLSFSVISEFFGRLFVIIVVGGVATAMMAPSRACGFVNWEEVGTCLAV